MLTCPNCGSLNLHIYDSRNNKEVEGVWRRRKCLDCGFRFTTREVYADKFYKKDGKLIELEPGRASMTDRKKAIEAASGLFYDQEFIDRLKTAKTKTEISQIMVSARKAKWNNQ